MVSENFVYENIIVYERENEFYKRRIYKIRLSFLNNNNNNNHIFNSLQPIRQPHAQPNRYRYHG